MTDLAQLTRRLVAGTAHWAPATWAARVPAGAGGASEAPHRADVVHRLVQTLADLGAEAESRPGRPVPRLDNDLALPDQLLVVSGDLLAAAPAADVATRAESALRDTHRVLFP